MDGNAKPSVLMVDDEPLVMRLLGRAVETMGFHPRYASDGYEALEEIDRAPAALVLTDYHMPGMTGVGLVEALVDRGAKTCPVILISGDDDAAMVRAGLRAGVDDFLVKGMAFGTFMGRVRFWTEGPFRALPEHIRIAALETMDRLMPQDLPVQQLRRRRDLLVEWAAMVMADQIAAAPEGFGTQALDRVRFLGVLDRVLGILARTCWLNQLQRVDALVEVVRWLDLPWGDRLLKEEMPRLAELRRRDMAFAHAAATLSVSVT
ncbi:response regulator [Pedomonas mirosovicensis]|uniref:response regulator n=1 Tax=Pedomonas mirosovicensis TaxID=2908641 RepID=UPI0021691DC6|nr:response regulator [Pedomonas mirosovicensis]MCH8684956.1 response regulator [Pedomonas mirosovicensis]